MRRLLLLLLMGVAVAWPSDITVCASGCTTTSLQTAVNIAVPGDTITLTEDYTVSTSITLYRKTRPAPPITIRGKHHALLPRGERPYYNKVTATADGRQTTLSTTLTTGPIFTLEAPPAWTQNCWASQLVGQTITVGYLHTAINPCEARLPDGTIYHSEAAIGTVTFLGVGGVVAGTSGAGGTGLRIGLGPDGKLWLAHNADLVYGTHFSCTNCTDTSFDRTSNFPETSIPLANVAYNTSGVATAVAFRGYVWLSGKWNVETDGEGKLEKGLYNGLAANAYSGPGLGPAYELVGLHLRSNTFTSSVATYMISYANDLLNPDYRYTPAYLGIDHCTFSQHKASKGYWRWIALSHADKVWIRDSNFINTQMSQEGQAIYVGGGYGPVVMENIYIDGGTENFMAGGGSSIIVAIPEIQLTRSLMEKRWEQYPKLRLVRQASTDTLALTGTDSLTRCNATTCKAAWEQTYYTYSSDSTIVLTAGTSASLFLAVSPTGVLTAAHNSGVNITCSGSITCLTGITSRSQIPEYAVLYEWTGTSGVWASTYSWYAGSATYIHHKNLFELKLGRNILVDGNIFRNYWASGQTQMFGVSARNQNGQDVFVRIDGLRISNNKFSTSHSGTNIFTWDDIASNTWGRNIRIENNIFSDINRVSYGNTTNGGIGMAFGLALRDSTATEGWKSVLISHNTVDADWRGFQTPRGASDITLPLSSYYLRGNFWWGNPYSMGMIAGDGIGYWNNVRKENTLNDSALAFIHPNSRMENNLYTTTAATIPTGFGTGTCGDLVAENFTGNVCVTSVLASDYFISPSSPMVHSDNLRIKTTSPYSVHYSGTYLGPTTPEGTDAGADVDVVETLTTGVVEGYAPLIDRWNLRVKREGTGATVTATSPSTLTLKIGPYQSLKTSDLLINDNTPDIDVGCHKSWTVTGLTATTRYWYTVSDGSYIVKGRL